MQERLSNNTSEFTKTSSGFQIKFENGYKISVQFGPMNYCQNKLSTFADYNTIADVLDNNNKNTFSSKDAEIAVITPSGEFLTIGNDQVAGWKTVNQVFRVMMCLWRHNPKQTPDETLSNLISEVLEME